MTGPFGRACRLVVAGGVATAAMAVGCASPACADWLGTERELTTGTALKDAPQLSGSRLAYADHTSERVVDTAAGTETLFDIRVLDLRTGADVNLTPSHTALGSPAISGDKVVWADVGIGADRGIWYRNLATGQQRRLEAGPGAGVRLSGDLLCYELRGRIHVNNLGTGRDQVVSPPGASASSCDISGDVVVWQDTRGGTDSDIYAYDLTARTETRLTEAGTDQTLPRIDNGLVVWQDTVDETNTDIVGRDLATGSDIRVTDDESVQWFADVADGRIVWMDERNGHDNTEIYAYDVASGVTTRVTDHDGRSASPTIAGDRIVYVDSRGAGRNLYLRLVTPARLTLDRSSGSTGSRPDVSGRLLGADGDPVTDEAVLLETSVDGSSWTLGATAVTDQRGAFTLAVDARPGGVEVRVRFAGTPEYPGAVSAVLHLEQVRVRAGLRAQL